MQTLRSLPIELAELTDSLLGFHDEVHGRILNDNTDAGFPHS